MQLWVYKYTAELNGQTGFVDVDEKLAAKLVKDGAAAYQYDNTLEIEPAPPASKPAPKDDAKPKRKSP